jgi:16S rRNA (adenine(1408)-N(1))-methyltransferase
LTLDLGTGDGRYVLARAAERPDELVIGVDASADAMAESSRRAARRGALPNALFVASAVEAFPSDLCAGLVTTHFPWGSLLRGASGEDRSMASLIAGLVRPGGTLRLLVSARSCDAGSGLATLVPSDVEEAYATLGLTAVTSRPASFEDAAGARSSWGKRLLSGRGDRRAWLFELRRAAGRAASAPLCAGVANRGQLMHPSCPIGGPYHRARECRTGRGHSASPGSR